MRLTFLAAPVIALTLPFAVSQTPQPAAKSAPAYESNPKFASTFAEAQQMLTHRQYGFALDAFKKANKITGGACIKCLEQIANIQEGMHEWKDELATIQQELALVTSPIDKSIAEARMGKVLLAQGGDKPKPAQLEAAHATLQTALADYPKNNGARWSDACVLARMGRTDESKQQFTACADNAQPTDPMRIRARHFAENPELSLHKMAPAFEVTALDGSRFNLDDMGGRVVLIDFWATWCWPCKEELPNVKRIAKDFANEPLTIISISWDADEAKWKDFINKNEMTWIQYRDADHKLSDRFGINAIPHYFTIDSDGILTAEILGSGNDVEGKLRKLLKRARESRPAAVQVSALAGAN